MPGDAAKKTWNSCSNRREETRHEQRRESPCALDEVVIQEMQEKGGTSRLWTPFREGLEMGDKSNERETALKCLGHLKAPSSRLNF